MADEEVLYEDGRIRISMAESPDEHNVYVDGQYLFLPRGVLKEWAEADSTRIRYGLVAMSRGDFPPPTNQDRIGLDKFGWACAKARLNELYRQGVVR